MTENNTTMTKTEQLIAAANTTKGVTVPELMEVTGQTMQVVRSRIYTLSKAGRLTTVEGSSPRRYKAIFTKPAADKAPEKAPAKKAAAKPAAKKAPAKKAPVAKKAPAKKAPARKRATVLEGTN